MSAASAWSRRAARRAEHAEAQTVPAFAALARLVDAVPEEHLVLDAASYTALIASVAYLRALPDVFQASRAAIPVRLNGYDRNPVALIRDAMARCPDEAPRHGTTELSFIPDPDLRDSIRLDMSTAHQDLAEGEWKGATVLAGSAIEALLLWSLQEHETQHAGARAAAIAALRESQPPTLTRQPDANVERWDLHEYVEVAAQLGIITPDTAAQTRLARRFRDLIHPGRAQRLGQKSDRSTALSALAAVEAVARDLMPP